MAFQTSRGMPILLFSMCLLAGLGRLSWEQTCFSVIQPTLENEPCFARNGLITIWSPTITLTVHDEI